MTCEVSKLSKSAHFKLTRGFVPRLGREKRSHFGLDLYEILESAAATDARPAAAAAGRPFRISSQASCKFTRCNMTG